MLSFRSRMDTVVSLFGNDPRRIGGAEEYVRELSLQLGRLGWQSVLCFAAPPAEVVARHLDLPNVSFEVVPEPWVNSFEVVEALAGVLRRRRPRILHYMFTGFVGPFPWLAKLCSVERVLHRPGLPSGELHAGARAVVETPGCALD
jgi:hypothetical protein